MVNTMLPVTPVGMESRVTFVVKIPLLNVTIAYWQACVSAVRRVQPARISQIPTSARKPHANRVPIMHPPPLLLPFVHATTGLHATSPVYVSQTQHSHSKYVVFVSKPKHDILYWTFNIKLKNIFNNKVHSFYSYNSFFITHRQIIASL
jgi:hypothetical protein